MDQRAKPLSPLANQVIAAFENHTKQPTEGKISVNPLISKVATWYEKVRNVMDYREEEVILRASIERILRRRILLGGTGKTIAEPLVRELVWARYFGDNTISESMIGKVAEKIEAYILLREQVLAKKILPEKTMNEWMYHLASSDIEYLLNPKMEKGIIVNFMFQILRESIMLEGESEQVRDVQVFIAVRRAFAKDDLAFLRFHLFSQIFGALTKEHVGKVAAEFLKGYEEINRQFSYKYKEKIYGFVKKKTAVFFILDDVVRIYRGSFSELIKDEKAFQKAVFEACENRYNGIRAKVRRAIIRSVAFILLTKVFFAFAIEGSLESLIYGGIQYSSLAINTIIPPLLMIMISFFIRIPGKENSKRIFSFLETVLFSEKPILGASVYTIGKKSIESEKPLLAFVFKALWFLAFIFTFGVIVLVLRALHFTIISMGVFVFFLAIVSFLSYRIGLTSRMYTVEEKPGIVTPIIDFLFMPIIRVGRELTEGISQVNIVLFLFDFLIETPFKGLFGFFEQWFVFLHAKREDLG